jgi:pyruvate formate lyase activating enzyme
MQDIPPTPRQTLYSAKQIAEEEGIKLVYLGNI